MTRRVRENLIYCGIALGSVIFLVWVIPAYTPAYPGYGVPASLTPNVAVGIILMLSIISLLTNFLEYRAEKLEEPAKSEAIKSEDRVHLWHLARFMIPCILLMPAMQWIGFIPAGLAFMVVIQYLCGQRKPVPGVLVAVGTVGLIYVVMRYGLSVPMP